MTERAFAPQVPTPPLMPAVFPPIIAELPPPPLELFDLDALRPAALDQVLPQPDSVATLIVIMLHIQAQAGVRTCAANAWQSLPGFRAHTPGRKHRLVDTVMHESVSHACCWVHH